MNLTLLGVVILTVWLMIRGYKKGMAKELSGLVALFAAFVVLALVIMLVSSFTAGEMTNIFYTIILLVAFGMAYGIVKFILRSAKAISHLPILHFLDSLCGIVVGMGKAIIIVWIVFLLCANNYLGPVTDYMRQDIEGNTVLKLLYGYNFFIK